MPSIWQTLETTRGPGAVPAVWKAGLGKAFDVFRSAFLRTRPKPAGSYPCPNGCGCAHKIVRHKSGQIVAVCQCEPSRCNDILLTDSDCVVLELNWQKLGRVICAAFGFAQREADCVVSHAIQIGAYGSESIPVVLAISTDRETMRHVVSALSARLRGPFILVAPSGAFVDVSCQEVLISNQAAFLSLESSVSLTSEGELRCALPVTELLGDFELRRRRAQSSDQLAGIEDRRVALPSSQTKQAVATDGPYVRCRGKRDCRGKNSKRTMRLWAIKFRAAEFDLPNTVGSEYLVHLLLNPNQELRPDELINAVEGFNTGTVSKAHSKDLLFEEEDGELKVALQWQPDAGHDVLNADEILRLQKMVKALEIAIREGKDDPGQVSEIAKWEQKRDELLDYLLESTKPGRNGKRLPKRFSGDTFTKQSNLIGKHLRATLKCMRSNDLVLLKHLNDKEVFRFGEKNYYKPPRGITWKKN